MQTEEKKNQQENSTCYSCGIELKGNNHVEVKIQTAEGIGKAQMCKFCKIAEMDEVLSSYYSGGYKEQLENMDEKQVQVNMMVRTLTGVARMFTALIDMMEVKDSTIEEMKGFTYKRSEVKEAIRRIGKDGKRYIDVVLLDPTGIMRVESLEDRFTTNSDIIRPKTIKN